MPGSIERIEQIFDELRAIRRNLVRTVNDIESGTYRTCLSPSQFETAAKSTWKDRLENVKHLTTAEECEICKEPSKDIAMMLECVCTSNICCCDCIETWFET